MARVWGSGQMAGVLRDTLHASRVWGQCGGGREVCMSRRTVQVRRFVVVGLHVASVGSAMSSSAMRPMVLAKAVTHAVSRIGSSIRSRDVWLVVTVGTVVVLSRIVIVCAVVAMMVAVGSTARRNHYGLMLLAKHQVLGTVLWASTK